MNRVQNNGSTSLGVILKLKKNRVIVMTDKLDFIELNRKPGMIRGQKVYYTSFDLSNSSFWSANYKNVLKFASAAGTAAAVFLLLFIGYRFLSPLNEYAYVDIDINPSVEMIIDKNESVLKAKALNSDGQILLDAVKVKKMELADAVTLLLDKSKEIGFINSDNNKVILSTAFSSNEVSDSKNENIETMVSSLKEIADKSGVESQVIGLSPEDRKQAVETGLSMGKYYIYNKAKDEGINITIEEVKNASIEILLSKVDIEDDVDNQNKNADANTTPEPIVTPNSTQLIKATPKETNIPSSSTATPHYTSSVVTTPVSSFIASFTPSPTANNENRPSFTSYRTYTPVHTPGYKTATPTPVSSPTPSPAPTATNDFLHTSSPTVITTPTKTPKPTSTKTPTPSPKPTTTKTPTPNPKPTVMASPEISISTLSPLPTFAPSNTPTVKTPSPITPTPTPIPTRTTTTTTTTPLTTIAPTPTSSQVLEPTVSPTNTPSPKPTIVSTPMPTNTPTPTPSPTPSPTATEKISVKLGMYNEIRTSETKDIHPRFKLANNGNTSIELSKIKIRYYYTIDIADKQQEFYCDWSDIGRNNITGDLFKMSSSEEKADYYLEVGFDSTDSLEPGSSIEIACRLGPVNDIGTGNEFYNQMNDYSFNDMSGDFTNWDRATVYVSGSLLWGSEP